MRELMALPCGYEDSRVTDELTLRPREVKSLARGHTADKFCTRLVVPWVVVGDNWKKWRVKVNVGAFSGQGRPP